MKLVQKCWDPKYPKTNKAWSVEQPRAPRLECEWSNRYRTHRIMRDRHTSKVFYTCFLRIHVPHIFKDTQNYVGLLQKQGALRTLVQHVVCVLRIHIPRTHIHMCAHVCNFFLLYKGNARRALICVFDKNLLCKLNKTKQSTCACFFFHN